MRYSLRLLAVLLSTLALAATVISTSAAALTAGPDQPANRPGNAYLPTDLAAQHARTEAAQRAAAGDASLDLIDHGGKTMSAITMYTIFWLPAGHDQVAPGYADLLNRYLRDVGGTPFYNIVTQYPSQQTGATNNSSTFGGTWTDTTAFPPGHDGSDVNHAVLDNDLHDAINRALAANPSWGPPSTTKLYAVFTGKGVMTCGSDSTFCFGTQYCAYHSSFNGNTIYAAEPYDADRSCTTQSTFPNGKDADVEASSLSHEQFEAATDPFGDGWHNNNKDNNEIGDLCAYKYGDTDSTGANLYLNGHPYLIQQEYSNAAHGCVKSYGPVPAATVTGSLDFGSVPRGQQATRTVTVTDTGNAPLTILDVRLSGDSAFTLGGPGSPQTVDPGGSVQYPVSFGTPLNTPTGPHSATLTVTSTDLIAGVQSVQASANVGKAASTVDYTGATTADYHDGVTASATVTAGGAPISGEPVNFVLGNGSAGETCTGTTNSAGAASCTVTPNEPSGPYQIQASYGGDAGTEPGSTSAAFTITPEETTLAYTGPTHIANGTPAHLSGVLKEDGAVPIAGRTVRFAMGTGAEQQTCTGTTAADGTAACTIDSVNQDLNDTATVPLAVSFDGDPYYRPSSATAKLLLQYMTGRSFGASANIDLPLLPLVVDPTPDTGPIRTARAITTSTPCQAELSTVVLTAKALCPNVTTTLNPGTSTATSTVADASIAVPGIPLIGVSGVKATSFSSCTATSASATMTLTIAGSPVTVPTAPNSVLDLGVAKLIVNEQHPVPGADFGTTVNALHLTGLGGLADVVLASATSDAHNCG